MMNSPIDDDALLAAARAAHDELDPPPDRLRGAAIRAATWDHGLDLLVSLVHDSQFAEAGLRSAAAPRDLVFEDDGITIELVVESNESNTTASLLRGEIDPMPDWVIVRSPGYPDRTVELDELGRFEIDIEASLVRVVAKLGDREVGTGLVTLFE